MRRADEVALDADDVDALARCARGRVPCRRQFMSSATSRRNVPLLRSLRFRSPCCVTCFIRCLALIGRSRAKMCRMRRIQRYLTDFKGASCIPTSPLPRSIRLCGGFSASDITVACASVLASPGRAARGGGPARLRDFKAELGRREPSVAPGKVERLESWARSHASPL